MAVEISSWDRIEVVRELKACKATENDVFVLNSQLAKNIEVFFPVCII